ncbi:MAG: DUF169 domain-containing protein [Candidatus Omnitrophica bacterium]|nr:DUF169 domain-containing protein [Candidatus Omnitrophota bacterium]
MENNEWKGQVKKIKEVLGLELSPVAVACLKGPAAGSDTPDTKVRMCRAILDAAAGRTVKISGKNNACFGAAWHLGFHKLDNPKVAALTRKFVVEGEKLFCSYEALDMLVSQMHEVPDNSGSFFVLSPMETADFIPQLAVFVCDADEASRLLTLAVFLDGKMPNIKIGGPTCRMVIMEPLLSAELNISFYDYTARKLCKVENDKLLVSMPYDKIPKIAAALDKCSAGTAKIEYPQEFREFLQKRMTR